MRKIISSVLIAVLALCCLCGCSEKQKKISVKAQRDLIELEVPASATVEKILEAAQITLAEKDKVTPALTEVPADGGTVTVERYAKVRIITPDGEKTVELTGATVDDALTEAGISLAETDEINVPADAFLSDLTEDIVITRSSSYTVTLKADGKTAEYPAKQQTVEEFLREKNISVAEKDRVTPALTETIKGDTEIVIARVTEKTETVTESIPFETKKEYSNSLYEGQQETKQTGVNGEKKVVYKITLVDGAEESRVKESEETVKEPVDEIIVYGAAPQTTAPVTAPPETQAPTEAPTEAPAQPPAAQEETERTVISRVDVPDCDGSGHGYYEITYSDGSVEYEEY